MNSLKISIIVPIYNTEKYLKRCIDSLINQTYQNIEIILVDDGSSDDSAAICKKYLIKDKRVSYYYQHNMGPSAARNTALEHVSGDFITYVDSDDYINTDMLESMLSIAQEYDADIVSCQYRSFSEEMKNHIESTDYNIIVYSGEDRFKGLYDEHKIATVIACGKLFRKEIFENIRYPIGKLHEDEYVIHKLLGAANQIVYMTAIYYNYYLRSDSITQTSFSLKRLDVFDALFQRIDYFEELGMKEYVVNAYCDYLKRTPYYYEGTRKIDKSIANSILVEYKQKLNEIRGEIAMMQKIRFSMFAYMPRIYCFIRNIAKTKNA